MDLIPKENKSTSSIMSEGGFKSRGISLEETTNKLSFLFSRRAIYSFVAIGVSLLIYGALFGYQIYAQRKAADLNRQADALEAGQDKELVQKVLEIDKTINSVNYLLKNHIYSSEFFKVLEKTTLPTVQWSNFTLDTSAGTANLSGKADSYSTLAKQIVAFKDAKFDISVSGISFVRDGVRFTASTKFDPEILTK